MYLLSLEITQFCQPDNRNVKELMKGKFYGQN